MAYIMTLLRNGEVIIIYADHMLQAVEIYGKHYPMESFSIKAAEEIREL